MAAPAWRSIEREACKQHRLQLLIQVLITASITLVGDEIGGEETEEWSRLLIARRSTPWQPLSPMGTRSSLRLCAMEY